jgi:CheY-like chemotaxis protein
VEAHGGTITAHSEPGEGAAFVFTLPLWDTSARKRADRLEESCHDNASWLQYALRHVRDEGVNASEYAVRQESVDVHDKGIINSSDVDAHDKGCMNAADARSSGTKSRRPSINTRNIDVNGCRSRSKGRRRHSLPWSPCNNNAKPRPQSSMTKCGQLKSPKAYRGGQVAGMWDEVLKAKSEALFELNSKNMVIQELEYCLTDLQQLRNKTERLDLEMYVASVQHRREIRSLKRAHERDELCAKSDYESLMQQFKMQQSQQQGLAEQLQANMRFVIELQSKLQQVACGAPSRETADSDADTFHTEYKVMDMNCFLRTPSSCSETMTQPRDASFAASIDKMPWHSEVKGGVIEVMSVDDTLYNHAVVERMVKTTAYKMTACMDGAQALRIIEKRGYLPDVLLLDAIMPHMDGYEVCEQFRKRFSDMVPVVMTSAKSENASVMRAFRCGCTDYVIKPYNKDVLLARIQAHLRLRDEWAGKVRALRAAATTEECNVARSDGEEWEGACNNEFVGGDGRKRVSAASASDWVEYHGNVAKEGDVAEAIIGEFIYCVVCVMMMMYGF